MPNFENYSKALIGRTDGKIDAVAGATMTRDGISEAVENALKKAKPAPTSAATSTFTPGTYEGSGKGYSEESNVTVKVTVDSDKITAVEGNRSR